MNFSKQVQWHGDVYNGMQCNVWKDQWSQSLQFGPVATAASDSNQPPPSTGSSATVKKHQSGKPWFRKVWLNSVLLILGENERKSFVAAQNETFRCKKKLRITKKFFKAPKNFRIKKIDRKLNICLCYLK